MLIRNLSWRAIRCSCIIADKEGLKTLAVPEPETDENTEERIPDCRLEPERVIDFPMDDDFDNVINDIEEQYGEELSEYFMGKYSAIQRTKCGGYPSFTQPAHNPVCDCGKTKEFFFQLSSEDTEEGVKNPASDNWSPHGIMIGDLGNIYFYVCKDCGEQSITSYWDCY
ncbi:DUF1963 domain-containing protein [Mucilaginibacter gracilis]|uniref:DUF1963 domain-containing protein n=1 Tax=Mucilaginibacter gracilis TaxID=423350 RepID=UPI000EB0E60A|nr:DUF1963 domain-containing protein [Mucilaginibacter gracilis]